MNSITKSVEAASVRQDVHTRVTDKITAELEQGVRPWMKPWSGNNAGERMPASL